MVRQSHVFIWMAAASLALSACGGSGSSSSYTSTTAAQVNTASSTATGAGTATAANPGYQIAGVVTGDATATLTLTGTRSDTTGTDSIGNYSFASVAPGSYTLSPRQTGYTFSPVSRAEIVSTASLTDAVFLAAPSTAATYTVSGTLTGSTAGGAVITLNGSNVGSTVTDLSGNYTFTGLVSGTYTVNASLDGSSFSAPLIVSVAAADSASNNFTSTASTSGDFAFSAVATLAPATIGIPYTANLVSAIKGGTPPYRYQSGVLDAGTPPLGMIVNPNGNLTGTAGVPGQYAFTVCAEDSAGEAPVCQATSITVAEPVTPAPAPAPTPTPTPTPVVAVTVSASPANITTGSSSNLTWSSANAASCTASGGWAGAKKTSGTSVVSPTSTTTYVMTCSGWGSIGKASVVVTVNPVIPPPPTPTVTLTSSAATITMGSTSTLKWSSKNATTCVKSGGWSGSEGASGSAVVAPSTTTTYSLACAGSGGTAQSATKVNVDAATPAPTAKITAGASTITAGGASTLTWSSTNADSCLASGAWTGPKSIDGTASVSPTSTATYQLYCSGAGGTTAVSAKVTVNAAPGNPPPTAAGTSWIYHSGQFDWPGDWPFSSTTNYADTSGAPLSGGADLKVTLTGAYGGWIPWAQNFSFNSAPYTKLTLSLKPTVANQKWTLAFVKVGDIPVGITLDLSNYGPAPVAGQWGTYTLPLAALGVLGQDVYKFVLQDASGAAGNTWYVDNVGFVP